MSAPVVGRFAPTPSGYLHLGNVLCAMLAYLSAKSQGGQFLLRIEDVDIPRCPESLGHQVIEDLQWLGFTWDAEPLWQSQRQDIYRKYLQRLEEKQAVYPCFCTRAQLHSLVAPNLGDTQVVYPGTCRNLTISEQAARAKERTPAIRLRTPDKTVTFTDGLYGVQQENLQRDCGDFVLRRADGLFGYQLAVVVDDALCGVTEVVRGRDILSSTPRQLYLQEQLGFATPNYVHIPLLMDAKGRRLAKRDADVSMVSLRKRFTPQQVIGALAFACGLLEQPVSASLTELIPLFSWNKIKHQDLCLPDFLSK